MNEQNKMKLGAEFPEASEADWRALAEKSLKGKPFEDSLYSTTYDGIVVNPLYTSADWSFQLADSHGLNKLLDHNLVLSDEKCPWKIQQSFSNRDPNLANKEILRDLKGGVNAVEIVFDAAARNGRPKSDAFDVDLLGKDGIAIHKAEDLHTLFDSVHLEMIELSLRAGMSVLPVASATLALLREKDESFDGSGLSLNADPIGAYAIGGSWSGYASALTDIASFVRDHRADFPKLTGFCSDTTVYHDGGASNAQELAFSLATGVAYLKVLVDAGVSVQDSFDQINFALSVDADLFASTSKIRALRKLWGRIAEASGNDQVETSIQALTSQRMLTRFDPWVNILRNVTAGFAGALGGADRLTIAPYDELDGANSELGRRVARNTHVILAEETMLGAVTDPAGGSWYVESYTEQLAEKAWALFQEIEQMGGIGQALSSGFVQNAVKSTRDQRQLDIANRTQASIGVSEFPNIHEEISSTTESIVERKNADAFFDHLREELSLGDVGADADSKRASTFFLSQLNVSEVQIGEPIEQYRDSVAFERLREASDRVKRKTQQRPKIFLGNWGTPAEFTARSTFAKNFFEAGGIEALSNEGFSDATQMAEAFRKSGASLIVLCSTDSQYEQVGETVLGAINGCDPSAIYIAGNPNNSSLLSEAGADTFIKAGMNVLDVLEKAYEILQVEI